VVLFQEVWSRCDPLINPFATPKPQSQGEGAPAEVLLMREACYRAIGEGFPHVAAFISFASWYSAEIAPQLRDRLAAFTTPAGANVIMAVLQARAGNGRGVASAAIRARMLKSLGRYQFPGNNRCGKPCRLIVTSNHLAPPLNGPLLEQARALWLVGACCGELPQEQWVEAYRLCVAHMGATDLVVSAT
jgi:hypothetical protein